ncbi:MAG: MotA/TolQ/ExbB proton channel family protein [Desulfatiglandales bacterium]
MDLATILGLVGGAGIVIASIIIGGSAAIFFNVPSILIVVGGTLAATFIKFPMKDVLNSVSVAIKAFIVKLEPPDQVIEKMVSLAQIAKKEGLIALERAEATNPFMAKAMRFLADGYDERLIQEVLSKDIRLTIQRHSIGQNVFKSMGTSAPAFGMIGTLVGLVQMLSNMSDPKNIGPAMAVALLTTLYGALLANLVFNPISDKLALRSQEEALVKEIILESAISMSQGTSARVLEEALKIYLAPKTRAKIEGQAQAQPAGAKAK